MMVARCGNCGAPLEDRRADLWLSTMEVTKRYSVGKTTARKWIDEVRRAEPDAVLENGRCIRVLASAVERLGRRS